MENDRETFAEYIERRNSFQPQPKPKRGRWKRYLPERRTVFTLAVTYTAAWFMPPHTRVWVQIFCYIGVSNCAFGLWNFCSELPLRVWLYKVTN